MPKFMFGNKGQGSPVTTIPDVIKHMTDEIKDGSHLDQIQILTTLTAKLESEGTRTRQSVAVMLGAICYVRKCIYDSYYFKSNVDNSRVYKRLGELTIIQNLEASDDKETVEKFCLQAFLQFYKSLTFGDAGDGKEVLNKEPLFNGTLGRTVAAHNAFKETLESMIGDRFVTIPDDAWKNLVSKKAGNISDLVASLKDAQAIVATPSIEPTVSGFGSLFGSLGLFGGGGGSDASEPTPKVDATTTPTTF